MINKDYNKLSKDELLKLVEKQEAELDSKKYGLVWDREKEPEQVVLDCEKNLPTLKRLKEINIDASDDNILIEGDNYHALTVLNYTHREKIDAIYIDPPYNTGKKEEWKYNDSFIDENNSYRHAMWLNMMEKRLALAKNLLKDDGVIFISIDDNEVADLKQLCNQIFFENNFIAQITREAIKGGSKSNHLRECHDYILIYAKNKCNLKFSGYQQDGIELNLEDSYGKYAKGREYNKWGASSRREDSPTMWFPIPGPNGEEVFPIRNDGSEGRWRLGKKNMLKKVENGDAIFEKRKDGTYIVYEKIRDNSSKVKQFTTLFKDHYINAKGGEVLKEIFGTSMSVFNYAKPVELIYDLLIMADCDDDAIILDFFAGSGTTAQAVLELNKQDGGNRKFILCTNNEGNICTDITYPRLDKIMNGYNYKGKVKSLIYEKRLTFAQFKNIDKILNTVNEIIEENKNKFDEIEKILDDNIIRITGVKNIDGIKDGLGGNLQYFKTDLIPVDRIDNITDRQRNELTEKAGQMIAVKDNTFKEVEACKWYQIFESKNKKRKTAIYFRENTDKFEELVKKIGKEKTVLYVFSYGVLDKKLFKYLGKNIVVEDIPEPIIDIYKEINQTLKDK